MTPAGSGHSERFAERSGFDRDRSPHFDVAGNATNGRRGGFRCLLASASDLKDLWTSAATALSSARSVQKSAARSIFWKKHSSRSAQHRREADTIGTISPPVIELRQNNQIISPRPRTYRTTRSGDCLRRRLTWVHMRLSPGARIKPCPPQWIARRSGEQSSR
jgi:hypothetical protein